MKYLGIIPARGNSKSIPLKNLVKLNGIPLLQYTIEAAISSRLDRVVISTDSNEIMKFASKKNIEYIVRPDSLSTDTSQTIDAVKHLINSIDKAYDAVVILQPTSPFRNFKHIDDALSHFENNKEADSLVSVIELPHNYEPFSLMTKNDKGFLENFIEQKKLKLRRQDKDTYFARNGAAIYITKTNLLTEGLLVGNILPFLMSFEESVDIDDFNDLRLAEIFLESNYRGNV